MRKIHWELVISIVFVLGGSALTYSFLANESYFWNAQRVWSVALIIGWSVVSFEYFRQGWMIHRARTAVNVSAILPATVFAMQCVLFIKGVYFGDWSLVIGALIVNSGVVFTLYQIAKMTKKR